MTKRSKLRRKALSQNQLFATAIPGYEEVDPRSLAPKREDDPIASLAETTTQLLQALRSRDVVAVLAKSGEQFIRELGTQIRPGASGLEQVHIELLQAFALASGQGKPVPASPRSMVKIWALVERNLSSYLQSTAPGPNADDEAKLAGRVRMRTVLYRNIFNSDDAAEIVPALLEHMDAVSDRELDYRLSDFARAMFALINVVEERLNERFDRERVLRLEPGAGADGVIETMLEESEDARRIWRAADGCPLPPEGRSWAGFQMAEMLCAPLFTFTRTELEARFGPAITDAIFTRSLALGSIEKEDLGRLYLSNPIWERPFMALDDYTLLLPVPSLIVSFPFMIVEGLMAGNVKLEKVYGTARTRYLEDDIERIVRRSLPSARVHAGVKWKDPDKGVQYEHDVVAVLGMQVLVFEAKSGKLSPSGRRGGVLRLKADFEKLFIQPGVQATRLETLLATRRSDVELKDSKGEVVHFETQGPSQVHKFGVCIEQFAGITGSRRFFRETGLLKKDQDWAPILTLGELRMISERLDTEVSFLHYLTRRMTADDLFDFVGDEQDLLSMYLMNRFILEPRGIEDRQVLFLHADAAVRGRTTARADRREFATHGPSLPSLWKLIAKEVYADANRHRFDILVTILNQENAALEGMAQAVRRWRSGGGIGKGNTLSTRVEIGDRVFVVAVHMAKLHPDNSEDWRNQARLIALDLHQTLGATDCVVVLKSRRSKSPTFDGISFVRFPRFRALG